ncbi:MAG: DUF1223 domain-containing protein [Paracoccaceae bacterium]
MKHVIPIVTALSTVFSIPAWADSPVVVELFTSQGCSSCPPADKLFHQLADREDVIALSLHVDYWDYIGWKDEFADPANAERQRGYASVAGRRSIYTPQMVVNGTTDIVGTRPMALGKAISEHAASPSPLDVSLVRDADEVVISAESNGVSGPLIVQMLRYSPVRSSKITRGENAGNTLEYSNVSEGWLILGEWNGATPFEMRAKAEGDKPVVVLVQRGRNGPIVGAARLR